MNPLLKVMSLSSYHILYPAMVASMGFAPTLYILKGWSPKLLEDDAINYYTNSGWRRGIRTLTLSLSSINATVTSFSNKLFRLSECQAYIIKGFLQIGCRGWPESPTSSSYSRKRSCILIYSTILTFFGGPRGYTNPRDQNGGESGIRTHGGFKATPVFKTSAINRSTISPYSHSVT